MPHINSHASSGCIEIRDVYLIHVHGIALYIVCPRIEKKAFNANILSVSFSVYI